MAAYACHECCEVFDLDPAPRRALACPGCGPGTKVTRVDDDRERDEDDGSTYGHPGDERDERMAR